MIDIPKQAEKALEILNNAGYEAYIVGGAVRSAIMKLNPNDIDITTNAFPDKVKELFNNYKLADIGIKHGTVMVLIDDLPIEITTFRTESGYADNRHPDSVNFTGSLIEDCARRDFTMNAICYSPQKGIIDFYNGKLDIENQIIKCVGEPDKRFKEDALRILRAIRFASVLGFDIDENTKKAIFENCHLLKNISSERIYIELKKMLCGKNIKKVLLEYVDVLSVVIPQLKTMENFDQKNPHHIYDVLTHTAVVVENVPAIPQLRLAALFHDIGKPDTFTLDKNGVGHFYNHAFVSLGYTQRILENLKVSSDDYKIITRLVEYHDLKIIPEEKYVLHALNKHGEEFLRLLLLLKRADNKGQNTRDFDRTLEYDELEKLINLVIEKQKAFSLKQLNINGNDLTELGVKPSAITGQILNMLLNMVIEGKITNTKEDLMKCAEEIINKTLF